MTDKRQIKKLKKEFERLVKAIGVDNLSDPILIEKSIELERELYNYFANYRQMLLKEQAR